MNASADRGAPLERRIDDLNAAVQARASRYADLLGAYFDSRSEAMSEVRAAHMLSQGDRLPVPPALVPRDLARHLGRLHAAFRAALEYVFTRRMGGSWARLADELRLDEPTRRYLDCGRTPRWAYVARPDVVVHGHAVTMVEPNVGTSCGAMPDADILGRLFESAPVVGDYLREVGARRTDAVGAVADLLRADLVRAGEQADALVVVVMRGELLADPTFYHCSLFARELQRHGLRAEAVAVEDLEVTATGVSCRSGKVGAVYRMCGEQPDPEGLLPALGPLTEAARRGRVALLDDVGDQIAGNKTVLALLSEELDAGRLPSAIGGRLASFVPWSRLLEDRSVDVDGGAVDLLPWCEKEQEDLVVKPGSGFQGRGVTLGCEVTTADWRRTIEDAVQSPEAWLVQRLVRSQPTRVSVARGGRLAGEETFVDYGYFAVGDTVPAAAIRRSAPFGTPTRRIKRAAIGPVFFV